MKSVVSENCRLLLVQSLPAVEANQDQIRGMLASSLARDEAVTADPSVSRIRAALLLSFLIRQAKEMVEGRSPRDLDIYRDEHRLNGIDGRHYSRFGDAMVPALRDILGPSHPRETAPAWCDAFWAVVQRMHESGPTVTPGLIAELVD